MSNPKNTIIPRILAMYLSMLVIYTIDLFAFQSDLKGLGDNFYARFISILIIFISIFLNKGSVRSVGISKKPKEVITGLLLGMFFSLIPIAVVLGAESLYMHSFNGMEISFVFEPPNLKYLQSQDWGPGIAITIFGIAALIGSFFKEVFFRGYLLKGLKRIYGFTTANILQTGLYVIFIVPFLLRNLVNNYYAGVDSFLGLFIVFFYIVHEGIGAVKWGWLSRVNGTIYIPLFDHFFYVFIANILFIGNRYSAMFFMIHMLAIEIVSVAMSFVFYKVKMKKYNDSKSSEKSEKEKAETEKDSKRMKRIKESSEGKTEISPKQFSENMESDEEKQKKEEHRRNHYRKKISDISQENLDSFLQAFTDDHREDDLEPEDVEEDFDIDSFLGEYQRVRTGGHTHHRNKPSREHIKLPDEGTQEPTEDESEQETEHVEEEPKQKNKSSKSGKGFFSRFSNIGDIDSSSSNDLI